MIGAVVVTVFVMVVGWKRRPRAASSGGAEPTV
jgi:hypothetical protein